MINEFLIKTSKYNISCKQYLPDDCKNMHEIIIACHGFGGDKESSTIKMLANEMVKKNIGVVCFDFPGHGKSEVNADFLTIENCINDINEIENYIINKYGNIYISIFSTSYGAYITLLNIAKNKKKYKNIILRSPAIKMYEIYVNTLLNKPLYEYKKNGFIKLGYEREMNIPYSFLEDLESNNILDYYSNMVLPEIYIIQGDKDDIAPIEDTKDFVNINKSKIHLYIIPGADHRMKKTGELEKAINYSKKIIKGKE